jgi:hypothetical protein
LDRDRLMDGLIGMGGNHKSFEEEGLVQDIRDRSIPYDMAAPSDSPCII